MYERRSNTQPLFVNGTFNGDSSGLDGGGIHNNEQAQPTLLNCTVALNVAGADGGGMNSEFGRQTIVNCIFWGNQDGEGSSELAQINGGSAVVNFCCLQNLTGKLGGVGNIGENPLFVDADEPDDIPGTEADDLRLSPGSLCIDEGNNWGVTVDELDDDEDGVLCELFPVDLDGNPRVNADEADFNPGCGVPVVVDMGAYEYQLDPADQITFADLNGDGAVGVSDLLGLLARWGRCAKRCCLVDLDIAGTVGLSDLLALLANWGSCP